MFNKYLVQIKKNILFNNAYLIRITDIKSIIILIKNYKQKLHIYFYNVHSVINNVKIILPVYLICFIDF